MFRQKNAPISLYRLGRSEQMPEIAGCHAPDRLRGWQGLAKALKPTRIARTHLADRNVYCTEFPSFNIHLVLRGRNRCRFDALPSRERQVGVRGARKNWVLGELLELFTGRKSWNNWNSRAGAWCKSSGGREFRHSSLFCGK